MNVLESNLRIVQNQFPLLHRFAFVFLFVLCNVLFFQPTNAQLFNPYAGYTCDNDEGCPWINDSTEFSSPPGSPNGHLCYAVVYYKYRTCNGYLELQPMAVRSASNCPSGSLSADTVNMFYGDTLVTQRMEQMLKNAERYLVSKAFKDFYNSLGADTSFYRSRIEYGTDTVIVSDSLFKIGFYRPACRGICISYGRLNASSPINSQYAKWYNCGEECCEIVSYLAYDTINSVTTIPPPGYHRESSYGISFVRIDYEQPVYTESCTSSTPNSACNNASFNTNVIRFHGCRNYCSDYLGEQYGPDGYDTWGLPNIDKRNGLINMNEMPYISDKILQSLPNDIMLESTSNDIVITISEEVSSVKIVSLSGVELQKYANLRGRDYQTISLQSLQNGLYMLVFETKTGTISKPLIIAK